MGIRITEIRCCTVDMFNQGCESFWFTKIDRILERYPFLELPHKQQFYSLLFIEKASGTAVIDDHHIRLDEPKVICITPGCVCRIDINRIAKGYIICFTEVFFSLRKE